MMKKRNRLVKAVTKIGLFSLLVMMSIVFTNGKASAKPYLESKTEEIGINDKREVYVYDLPYKAKLVLKSNKPKVAKISKKNIVGVKPGKAKVTAYYKKGKKTKKIGVVKVTVKKSSLYSTDAGWLSTQAYDWSKENYYVFQVDYASEVIKFYNPKAKYTVKSNNSSKLKLSKKGKVLAVNGKGGEKVSFTVNEKYKKKTRKVGTMKVSLVDPHLEEGEKTEYSGIVGRKLRMATYVAGNPWIAVTESDITVDPNNDKDPDYVIYDDDSNTVKFTKPGTFYMTYYARNYVKNCFETTPFAKVVYRIGEGTKTLSDFTTVGYNDDYDYVPTTSFSVSRNSEKVEIRTGVDDFTGSFSVSSSAVSVADVSEVFAYDNDEDYDDDEEDESGASHYFYINPHKSGEVTITIECSGITKEITATVEMEPIESDYGYWSYSYNGSSIKDFDSDKLSYSFSNGNLGLSVDLDYDNDADKFYVSAEVESEEGSVGETTLIILYDGKELTHYDIVVK